MFRFHLGPFPITVQLSFLFTALIFGSGGSTAPQDLLVGVVVIFVSVLFHELGHAVFGLGLGGRPEIVLQGLGGLTYPRLRKRPGALAQIGLSLAGPIAGLLLGGIAWLVDGYLFPAGPALPRPQLGPLREMLGLFEYVSVAWAVLNLLPVLPLDGGQVLESALAGLRKKPSIGLASWISVAVAGAVCAFALLSRSWFMALLFGMFAAQNFSRARSIGEPSPPPAPGAPSPGGEAEADVERAMASARAALQSGDESAALLQADRLEGAGDSFRQAAGLRIRAGVALSHGENQAAGLHAGRSFSLWPTPDAAVVAVRAALRTGDRERALNWLRRALEAGAAPDAVQADGELATLVAPRA